MSSVYIATVYPCFLSIANGGFVSFVNFQGPCDKPLGKTENFKSFELQTNLRKNLSLPSIFTEEQATFKSIIAM